MTPRKRGLVPYYQELAESRQSSFRTGNSWQQYYGPESFDNNAFTIEETSFAKLPVNPVDRLPAFAPSSAYSRNSYTSYYSDKMGNLPHSNQSVAWQPSLSRQQSMSHGDQLVAGQHSQREHDDSVPAESYSFGNEYNPKHFTKDTKRHSLYSRNSEENTLERSAKFRKQVKVMENDQPVTALPRQKALRDTDYYLLSQIGHNRPGTRDSYVSFLSTEQVPNFSLPRLSVHRSENLVDITSENQYSFTSFPE